MFDRTLSRFSDIDIQRIDAARIVMVEPGREYSQPSQLSAILMGENIVGVVTASPVIFEVP